MTSGLHTDAMVTHTQKHKHKHTKIKVPEGSRNVTYALCVRCRPADSLGLMNSASVDLLNKALSSPPLQFSNPIRELSCALLAVKFLILRNPSFPG